MRTILALKHPLAGGEPRKATADALYAGTKTGYIPLSTGAEVAMAETGVMIRPATAADAALVAVLIDELNADQGEPTGHVTAEAIRQGGFGARPEFRVLLAELDGAPVGYVLFHPSWSTEVGEPGLYIYDLYVRRAGRERGAGRALMAKVARIAQEEGRTFLWWCSKAWNKEAQAFYARIGAIEEPIKAHAVFGAPFAALAALAPPGEDASGD